MTAPRRSTAKKRGRPALFVVLALVTAFSIVSAAQTKQTRKPGARPAAAHPSKKTPPKAPADDPDAAAPLTGKEAADPVNAAKDAGKGGAVLDQKTLDGGQRVFRFGEVEVEGRLKSPQIVYFLRRVRAEFAAGDLGHRSFLPELGETKNEPSF